MADGRKGRRKIDLEKMHRMLREGKTQTEVARYFGVVDSAISQAIQRHKRNMMRTAVLDQAADIVESDLDLLSQLRKINRTINAQLERAVEEVEKAKDGDKRVAMQKIIVDLAGEIRKQLETGINIAKFWFDHEEFVNLREELIAILGEMSPDLRRQFVERLKAKRLLRGTVNVS